MTNDELELLVDRLADVVGDRVKSLVGGQLDEIRAAVDKLSEGLPTGEHAAVERRCGWCDWDSVTSSTHCGSCGRRLTIPESTP